jgi:hypothetical protein
MKGSKYQFDPINRTSISNTAPGHVSTPAGIKPKSTRTYFDTPKNIITAKQNKDYSTLGKTPKRGLTPFEAWKTGDYPAGVEYAHGKFSQANWSPTHAGSPIVDIQTQTLSKNNLPLFGAEREEIKRRVAAGLKNKANQDQIKRELGIEPMDSSNSSTTYRNLGAGRKESVKEQKTFSQFIAEAEQQLKMVRVYHGTSKSNAKKIKSDGFNDSEDGVYGSGVYSSTSRNVARRYSRDAGAASGKHDVDSGVVSSIIPSKKVKTIRQSSPESQEGRNTSKELRKSGQPAVRVKNAATGHETAKPGGGGHEDEADYIISDTKVVNKGIEKNPRVFRPTKDQKLDQTNKAQLARDYYRGKPGTERPYVDRKKGTKKIQTKSAKKI